MKTGIHLFFFRPWIPTFVGMTEEYVILHLVLFALGFLLQVYKLLISLILSFELWFCAVTVGQPVT